MSGFIRWLLGGRRETEKIREKDEPLLRWSLQPPPKSPPPVVAPSIPRQQIEPPSRKWNHTLTGKLVFVDVETTGLKDDDRIVSFGGVSLETAPLVDGKFVMNIIHLMFDPGKRSHPKAEKVHGYSDWTLRHQHQFSKWADQIEAFINGADLVVGHNITFDMRFIRDEIYETLGREIEKPTHCTMMEWRRLGLDGGSGLNAVARTLGLKRRGQCHGALEDTWLAMTIYLALRRCPWEIPFSVVENPNPTNYQEPPPLPDGPLPRRKRRPKPAFTRN